MKTLLTAPDIEYLRGQQMKLDGDIIEKNGITHDEWMYDYELKHHLALKVEVHEFINECHDQFKYWKKKPINRDRIIDEAVDVIHFVCLMWNKSEDSAQECLDTLGTMINMIEEKNLSIEKKIESLSESNNRNFVLAYLLLILDDYNFTTQDIIDAYNRKNAINFERLESGY